MPNEESVILLMGKIVMDKKPYQRQVPRIDPDKDLFPDETNNKIAQPYTLLYQALCIIKVLLCSLVQQSKSDISCEMPLLVF